MSDYLQPHGLQKARLPCPSPSPEVCSNSCPLSQWCHPTISSSVIPFSSRLQSFPASGSFPLSQFFVSGGQSIRASASASVPPMNSQDWFPLGLTGFMSLLSKGLSKVFSSVTVRKHQFYGTQPSLATWCKELTQWKRPWCWERLKAGREGDDKEWDAWMADGITNSMDMSLGKLW